MAPAKLRVLATQETRDGRARTGVLELPRASMETPAFMPVGTLATVKSLTVEDLASVGAQCILCNTYHLHLRPGESLVAAMGGLHRFMGGWPGLILTDSGGFQVFSLAHLREIDESGVTFRAHTDGSLQTFTPESVVQIQEELGSDIMMVLDECPAHTMTWEEASASAARTARWAERAKAAQKGQSLLFGIVQGGMHADLRRQSARELAALDFTGYGIGGLGVGEDKNTLRTMLQASVEELPEDRPRYLMGIGAPDDLLDAVARGVDMFDCVLQTREARNGGLLTRDGRLNVNNSRFRTDPGPIEDNCDCPTCARYSLAYLHHLFRNRELLAYRLATLHNVRWTIRFMEDVRAAIRSGDFEALRSSFIARHRRRAGPA